MSYAIRIEVQASLQDSWLIHRILNFKEDLQREFLRSGAASITDPQAVDRALDPLTIAISSKRSLAAVSKCIEKALLQHDISGSVHVRRLT